MPRQTVLPVDNARDASFDNFFGDGNNALVMELRHLVSGKRDKRVLYFWGAEGSGKSHLLHACCREFQATGLSPVYLSLAQQPLDPDNLTRIPGDSLVCIDDLQIIAKDRDYQVQLLALYERLMGSAGTIVVCGNASLSSQNLVLEDFASRLSSGGSYRLEEPGEAEKRAAMKARASGRGFSLDDHVVDFIMSHYSRDMSSLFSLLDRLDSASLESHRKITIPFVRGFL